MGPVVAFLIALFVVFTLVAVAMIAKGNVRRQDDQWRAAADRLQLSHRPGRFLSRSEIYGPLADLIVSIDQTTASGSSESTVTRYRVRYPSLGFDLHLSRQTPLTWASSLFGETDLQTGDPEFDNAFAIRTSDPQRLADLLSTAPRRTLLELVQDFPSARITDEEVSVESKGVDRDAGTLVETTRRLIEAARILQGPRPRPLPESESDRSIPILPQQPETIRSPSVPPPPPAPVAPAPHHRRKSLPDEPAPEPPPPAFTGVRARDLAREVFGRRGLSYEIADSFAKHYQGTRVDWPGEVMDVRTGLGPDDSTRVTIRVASVEHELFGMIDIQVVASMTGDEPRLVLEGEPVRVKGTLAEIDVMSRRLYVDDALVEALPKS